MWTPRSAIKSPVTSVASVKAFPPLLYFTSLLQIGSDRLGSSRSSPSVFLTSRAEPGFPQKPRFMQQEFICKGDGRKQVGKGQEVRNAGGGRGNTNITMLPSATHNQLLKKYYEICLRILQMDPGEGGKHLSMGLSVCQASACGGFNCPVHWIFHWSGAESMSYSSTMYRISSGIGDV